MSAVLVLPYVWALATDRPTPVARPTRRQHTTRTADGLLSQVHRGHAAPLRAHVHGGGQECRLCWDARVSRQDHQLPRRVVEDVVIFIHDIERCLERLDVEQQQLIARIALQQYTLQEGGGG